MHRTLLVVLALSLFVGACRPTEQNRPSTQPASVADNAPKSPEVNVRADPHKIVFLVDATGSMINKMAKLQSVFKKAVGALTPDQSFDIIFFQDVNVGMMSPELVSATPESKQKAADFLEGITATGTTNPTPAMMKALQLKPDLLYFATDAADFPDQVALLKAIQENNGDRKIKINTMLVVDIDSKDEPSAGADAFLKQIARDSGGEFGIVMTDPFKQ